MGSGPECPHGCSSRLSVAFAGLVGCAWNPQGKRLHCTQIITAHQLLPLSHLFTQQLCLAEMRKHSQTRTHTYRNISHYASGLQGRNDRETLLFEEGCAAVCEHWVGQFLQLNIHNSSSRQSVFVRKFSHVVSGCSFHLEEDMTEECCFSDTQIPNQYLSSELFMTAIPRKLYVAY